MKKIICYNLHGNKVDSDTDEKVDEGYDFLFDAPTLSWQS